MQASACFSYILFSLWELFGDAASLMAVLDMFSAAGVGAAAEQPSKVPAELHLAQQDANCLDLARSPTFIEL